MNRNWKVRAAAMTFATLIAASAIAADSPGADRPPQSPATQVSGIVAGYNLDPRGSVNGIILKDGDHLAQLNLPPDQGAPISAAAPIGQKIQASAIAERTNGDHSIYRLVSLTGPDGKEISIAGPQDGPNAHVEGTVKSLNYTPRGDVDGAILDNGDFLQLGPGGAADVKLALDQKISADGKSRPMPGGHNIINPSTVNGTTIHHPPHRPGMHGPGGPRGPGGPGGSDGQMDGPPPGPDHGN
jgi:hypothetical protein